MVSNVSTIIQKNKLGVQLDRTVVEWRKNCLAGVTYLFLSNERVYFLGDGSLWEFHTLPLSELENRVF